MQNILLFGCGSKWGKSLAEYYAQDNNVDLVTSSRVDHPNVNNLKVDWFNLNREKVKSLIDPNKHYDIVFFNHNSGGAPGEHNLKDGNELDLDHWNYSYWINCQLPYVVIHHLNITHNTKIGWMLTGLIVGSDKELYKFGGYAGVKSTNLHLMRGFSVCHPGIFFAINPIWFPLDDYEKDAKQIASVISNIRKEDNGKAINKDGSEWII